MASLTLLLHLLLMVSATSAWSRTDPNMKRFFGGSLTVTPKGRNSDGTYEVSLILGAKRIGSEGILSHPDLYNVPD